MTEMTENPKMVFQELLVYGSPKISKRGPWKAWWSQNKSNAEILVDLYFHLAKVSFIVVLISFNEIYSPQIAWFIRACMKWNVDHNFWKEPHQEFEVVKKSRKFDRNVRIIFGNGKGKPIRQKEYKRETRTVEEKKDCRVLSQITN